MSGEILKLDDFRAVKKQVAIRPPIPQEILAAAADLNTVEWMHRISEMLMDRIASTNRGLEPPVRAIVNEAVAILRGQPRSEL